MTIEEAIAHAREVAEGCPAEGRQCAYQHDKLADWLEELKAYRDSKLTPEEISKLKSIASWADTVEHELEKYMEIEKEDRLVILPCKVTETVYVIEDVFERKKVVGKRVASAQIDHVTIGGTTGKPVFDLCTETGGWYYSMEPDDFYLTREAAEAALKKQETAEDNFKCTADSAGYCQKWLRGCVGWCNCGLKKEYGAPCPGCENASPLDNEKCQSCIHKNWKIENYVP